MKYVKYFICKGEKKMNTLRRETELINVNRDFYDDEEDLVLVEHKSLILKRLQRKAIQKI